jgi:hypothetical protein
LATVVNIDSNYIFILKKSDWNYNFWTVNFPLLFLLSVDNSERHFQHKNELSMLLMVIKEIRLDYKNKNKE